jgi:hypothetical protein
MRRFLVLAALLISGCATYVDWAPGYAYPAYAHGYAVHSYPAYHLPAARLCAVAALPGVAAGTPAALPRSVGVEGLEACLLAN